MRRTIKCLVSPINLMNRVVNVLARNLDLDNDQTEIAYYGLQLVWSFFLSLVSAGLLALLTGTLFQAVAGALASGGTRLFAGGAHSNSPWRCALVGAVLLSAIGRLAIYLAAHDAFILPYFAVVSTLAALAAVWFLAPVDSPAKPITDPRHRRNLRNLALGAVIILGSSAGILAATLGSRYISLAFATGLGLLWEGFTLTGSGHRLLEKLDGILSLRGKEGIRC